MPTSFKTFQVFRQDGDVRGRPLTSASLYLDTSDLSYLLLGTLHSNPLGPPRWRSRLEALLRADRVRLRLSPVHLAEMSLRGKLREPAMRALSATPNVYLVTSAVDSVFHAELEQKHPVALVEHRASRADIENLTFSMRWFPRDLAGVTLARLMKAIVRLEAGARNQGKAAQQSETTADKERTLKLLRGETEDLPWWIRPAATAFSRFARWLPPRFGLPSDAVERMIKEEKRGLGWATTMAPSARLPRKDGKRWNMEDVRRMPATVLRACVENAHTADPNRPADDGTRYDVEHLAFVAYSDFSTIDKANLDAVRPALRHLPERHVFKAGNLDPVLDAIEKLAESDPRNDPEPAG
jgi:hypothetical protein